MLDGGELMRGTALTRSKENPGDSMTYCTDVRRGVSSKVREIWENPSIQHSLGFLSGASGNVAQCP